ncbi:aryl hydrocarbon receptor 2 isoform X3 [Mastacembelus armatus]|uniref:aryl hydrocarbon receptor 2 isoform X3 n=1 Tax=Mastacembelus armatus TaxID=205130 RepID=UPI000E456546|nr:aryl hydrocarbon receptor-like isoform X3 [Mastacembelus armatus]
MSTTALYAAKKRKKPVQKIPKPPPPDGIKSNPSKRHRDRLNSELDKLTSLLPFNEEVRARLDKLSVLRLSVGYLKVKSFFNATMKKGPSSSSWTSERSLMFGGNVQNVLTPPSTSSPSFSHMTSIDGVSFSEGELLLQALNGFVLVVTAEGYIFYTSPTIQDFLGFHQSDVVHQSVFELIHTDDRALFRRQLHFALNPNPSQHDGTAEDSSESSADISNVMTYNPQSVPPENSTFLERNFCCRFRCLLDNSSGFLALNFRGRLKFLHGQNRVSEDGTLVPPQLALFSVATPMQPPSILEIRTKTLFFQTKHKLDFTPMGIDTRGKVVLGYNEVELCMKGSGYHFIHAADMMYCADNHIKMIKTGESGLTIFRLLTKSSTWIWVQANARLVFKGGRPDFIVARQRALTNEEGEEQLRLRRLQLPFNFTTGEAMLYDVTPTVDTSDLCSAPKQRKLDNFSVSPNSLLGCMLRQDQSVYCEHNSANALNSLNDVAFKDTHATLNVPGDSWQHASPRPVGSLVKSEETVQDMMETLQQILGDSDLTESLNVEPDELKSWESMLLKMNTSSCDLSDDLNDILSDDILSYVEQQLQEITSRQTLPPVGLSNTGAPMTFNPNMGNFAQTPKQLAKDNNFGVFRQASQHQPNQTAQPTQNHLQMSTSNFPIALQDQSTEGQLNPMFNIQGNQWNSSAQLDNFVGTYNQNMSNEPGFTANRPSSNCSFALQTQNSENQRQSWPLEQQQQQQLISSGRHQMGSCLNQMSGFQRNPLSGVLAPQNAVNGRPAFRGPETPSAPFSVPEDLELPSLAPSSSCMFRNATSSVPVSGGHLNQPSSCQRANLATNQIPSKPSCFYQGLPTSRSVKNMMVPNPDQTALSCQMTTGLDPNGLQVQEQPYLNFGEQTQINSCSVVGNEGFPFPLQNGNPFYSENK